MLHMLINPIVIILFGTVAQSATAEVGQRPYAEAEQAELTESTAEPPSWFWLTSDERRKSLAPPAKLAIIACRTESSGRQGGADARNANGPDWRLPVECMRVIETVTDSAALNNLWLRQMTPNLADYGTCAELSMAYAPEWEAAHKNWVIVKVGCPTKLLDANGNIVGWHMPECQGTLPGTLYPLRCRFDPAQI